MDARIEASGGSRDAAEPADAEFPSGRLGFAQFRKNKLALWGLFYCRGRWLLRGFSLL